MVMEKDPLPVKCIHCKQVFKTMEDRATHSTSEHPIFKRKTK